MTKKKLPNLNFIGMTKKEVLEELGDGFNFYPNNFWYYELSKTWYGITTILFLEFENDRVIVKYTQKIFGKIKFPKRE